MRYDPWGKYENGRQLREALPGLPTQASNCLAQDLAYQFGDWPGINTAVEALRMRSDDDLLGIRNFGPVALAILRTALATTDFDAGPCNWVGEGVPA